MVGLKSSEGLWIKSPFSPFIPAQAGIQCLLRQLDSRLRGNERSVMRRHAVSLRSTRMVGTARSRLCPPYGIA